MTTRYYTNSCSNDGLDSNCFCYGLGPSSQYKIFDVTSGSYLCCGNIPFKLDVDNPDAPITGQGAAIKAAALADDPRCTGWWYGSAGNFDNTISPIVTLNQPVTGFFLPDASQTNGNMPYSYGPSNQDLLNATYQASIYNYFTLPTNTSYSSNQGTTAACDVGNIYWLNHLNPNKGLEFVTNMVCFDTSRTADLKSNTLYNNGNWALFNANCANGTSPSTCNYSVGEVIAPPVSSKIGSVFLSTPGYTGGKVVPPAPPKTSNENWIIWTILGVILLVIVVIIILYFTVFRKKGKSKVAEDDSNSGDNDDNV